MFLNMVANIARFALVALPVAITSVTAGCSDSGGGSPGTGGSGGTGGTGGGGTGGSSSGKICTAVAATAADMSILDFNAVAAGATQATFGGYMMGSQYGGGTFIYPDAGMQADLMGLSNTFAGMTWHITGLVKNYSGFGLYLTSVSDLSMFGGLSYDISGTFTMVGTAAPPATTVNMTVTDIPHEADSLHTRDGRATCGTCMPAATEDDGTCAVGAKTITLTGTATTQTVRWNDLTDGRRPPSFTGESPNPTQITAIGFALPWSGDTSPPYMVDITVDNIKFIAP